MVAAEKSAIPAESLFVKFDLLSEARFIAQDAKDKFKFLGLPPLPPDEQT